MKNTLVKLFIISCFTSSTLYAGTVTHSKTTPFYSPYVDLTLEAEGSPVEPDKRHHHIEEANKAAGVNSFHLAFITDGGSCNPAWGGVGDYSVNNAWGKNLTDKMRANNIDYIVSFGGASGTDISKACDVNQLVSTFENVVTTYQPKGLDFDIENGTADVTKIMAALKVFQNKNPKIKISFTLPAEPDGLTKDGKNIVTGAQSANLNYSVNLMTMDFGDWYDQQYGCVNDMGGCSIKAANSLFSFLQEIYPNKSSSELWQMVELTPMIGINDVAVEKFTLSNADALRSFANRNQIGGLAIWSISRDNSRNTPDNYCSDKWTTSYCSGLGMQSKDYEFSEHLK